MQIERLLNKNCKEPYEQPSLFADLPLATQDGQTTGSKVVGLSAARDQATQPRSSEFVDCSGDSNHLSNRQSDHLAAAHMLAKKLRSSRRKPATRQRAGIAICQHLIALLHESEQAEQPLQI